jgi:hypothetical protein
VEHAAIRQNERRATTLYKNYMTSRKLSLHSRENKRRSSAKAKTKDSRTSEAIVDVYCFLFFLLSRPGCEKGQPVE